MARALRLGLAAVTALAVALAETPANVPVAALSPADTAFDIRVDLLTNEKSDEAAFHYAETEFTRDPRPHVKARYAEFLIEGKAWGAPEGQADRGWALAQEARRAGSLYSLRIIGW